MSDPLRSLARVRAELLENRTAQAAAVCAMTGLSSARIADTAELIKVQNALREIKKKSATRTEQEKNNLHERMSAVAAITFPEQPHLQKCFIESSVRGFYQSLEHEVLSLRFKQNDLSVSCDMKAQEHVDLEKRVFRLKRKEEKLLHEMSPLLEEVRKSRAKLEESIHACSEEAGPENPAEAAGKETNECRDSGSSELTPATPGECENTPGGQSSVNNDLTPEIRPTVSNCS